MISELQDRVQGAQWFTKIDIKNAYHRIRMAEGEEWKTAFQTRYGHYEYTVMPFGLTNVPASLQSLINDTLRNFLNETALAYIDKVLVYIRRTLQEHIQEVRKILQKLLEKGLKVNPEKCEFHKKEVSFLGSIISTEGIRMDPEKIRAIMEWPQPIKLKELQAFLGFANYYRRFIKGYSKTAEPLTQLTQKKKPFDWNTEAEEAFQELKEKF